MIDPSMFTVEQIVDAFFGDLECDFGHGHWWKRYAVIIPQYMPPFPRPDTRPRCVVKFDDHFLRHSGGPRQGHFWDMYGDHYQTPGLALRALFEAPIPPSLIGQNRWQELAALRGVKP